MVQAESRKHGGRCTRRGRSYKRDEEDEELSAALEASKQDDDARVKLEGSSEANGEEAGGEGEEGEQDAEGGAPRRKKKRKKALGLKKASVPRAFPKVRTRCSHDAIAQHQHNSCASLPTAHRWLLASCACLV